jgi:hypothetical protein
MPKKKLTSEESPYVYRAARAGSATLKVRPDLAESMRTWSP